MDHFESGKSTKLGYNRHKQQSSFIGKVLPKINRLDIYFILTLIVLTLFIYAGIIQLDPLVQRDDHWIIDPLRSINGLKSFFQSYSNFLSPDFQPIRDLSLIFDLKFQQITGISIFHFINWIIWITICLYCWFQNQSTSKKALFFIFLLMAVSPLATSSIGWVSARKHLLATLFSLMAIHNYLKSAPAEISKKVILYYALSVLSQPIFILFPIWIAIHSILKNKILLKLNYLKLISINLLMLFFIFINQYYYKSYYLKNSHQSKLDSIALNYANTLTDMLMKLGHYLYHLILPNNLTIIYNPDYIISYCGLIFLFLSVYMIAKVYNWRNAFLYISLLLLPLAIPITKIKILFINDTYLLIPLVLLFNTISLIPNKISDKIKNAALILLILISLKVSIDEVKAWYSTEDVLRKNFYSNPNCESSGSYAFWLFHNSKFSEAVNVGRFHVRMNCFIFNQSYLVLLLSTYHDKLTKINDKINTIDKLRDKEGLAHLLLAKLYSQNNQPEKAFSELRFIDDKKNIFFYQENIEDYLVEFKNYCQKSISKDCQWFMQKFYK